MKVEYKEVSLDTILKRAAEQFAAKLPDGQSLYSHHAFVDVQKGVVVFKFYIDNDKRGAIVPARVHQSPCPGGFWALPRGVPGHLPAEGVCSECGRTATQHRNDQELTAPLPVEFGK